MFTEGQPVTITTTLGGTEQGIYKQPLPALGGIHEVWVDNKPSRSRLVWTSNVKATN